MKIKTYISVTLLTLLALTGCSDDGKSVEFGLDSQSVEIGAEGGVRKIKISSEGRWIATTDNPWITISPANGRGSTECELLIDSALTNRPRHGAVRIQNQENQENREINIDQDGFDYTITLEDADIEIANYALFDERSFDVKIRTNVDFDIQVPDDASWLKFDRYSVEFDRGIRPREVTIRFNWGINTKPMERIADVVFKPKSEVELARQDNLLVTQEAAAPIVENTRAGDSVALLGAARSLQVWGDSWDGSERMDLWSGVTLWEEGMEGYTPEKDGRVKSARFFMFDSKEGLPYEVQYLTAAEELYFYANSNSFLRSLSTGEYITKLTELRRLTIGAYGLTELHTDFINLKNLEYLSLEGNNFQKIPPMLTKENFPKLRVLNLGANTRSNIYDLSNTVTTNFGGLFEEEGFPRRILEWDLDSVIMSVNYLQGSLPAMDDWETYTEQDIIDADTLPRALIGTPKVMPHTKWFTINLNRLTGKLPDWLLYHPALDWWAPFILVFNQEGKDVTGKSAGFDNEPLNMNYYYEFYKGFKNPNYDEEEEETPSTK